MSNKEFSTNDDSDLMWQDLRLFIKETFSHLPEPAEYIDEEIEDLNEEG